MIDIRPQFLLCTFHNSNSYNWFGLSNNHQTHVMPKTMSGRNMCHCDTHTWKLWVFKLSEAAQWRYGDWISWDHRIASPGGRAVFQAPTFEFQLHHIWTECHQLHAYPILYGHTVCANLPFLANLALETTHAKPPALTGQKQQRHVVNVAQCASLFWRCGRVC